MGIQTESQHGLIMTKIQVVNVVATASVDQQIDFGRLRRFSEIFHDSDVYGGRVAYFKNREMTGKVSIFLSGKMISAGTKSETQAFRELELAKRFLLDKNIITDISLQAKTQNIVVSAEFQEKVNFEELTEKSGAIYEPEQFPGAILRLYQPFKASVLVFASGKAVITGLKSTKQIEPIIEKVKEILATTA